MKKLTNELKTGIVIVIAILIGIFFWLKTSSFKTQEYVLKTHFSHAAGIKNDAIVSLAGIEVGRVSDIKFLYEPEETKVELTLLIDKKAKVRADSIAFVGTTGFIGDAHIGITPGTSKVFLKKNTVIPSEDPIEMRKLMKRADSIAKSLDVICGDVKTIVSDNKEKVDNIVTNLEVTSSNFKEFSDDIKKHPWKLLIKGREEKKKKKR